MAPILLNAAASVAGDLLENISDRLSSPAANPASASSPTSFASAMAQAQATPAVQAAALADQQANLTSSLMASPEVRAALATANPGQSAQLEISSSGSVSLRSANGSVKPIHLSTNTQSTVNQLYKLRQPNALPGQKAPTQVLAVDPARITAPTWSMLPARI